MRVEKDYLLEMDEVEEKTTEGGEEKVVRHTKAKALSTRFILLCLSNLHGKIARNWNKFENFLTMLN